MKLNLSLVELQSKLHETFYNMDDAIEVIYNSLKFDNNLILYGPGGYGKSTLVVAILEELGIKQSIITGYEDMPVEAILGMPDMKKMTDESIYEIAFDRSPFANSGILILEEFLEVAPATLASLKDILSSGGLRQGDKFYKSNIDTVIICTNKDPRDLAKDQVAKSLVNERFPIHYQVNWEDYSTKSYLNFIKFIVGDEITEAHKILAELCSRNESAVSPRILKTCIARLEGGLNCLHHISGLDTSDLDSVIQEHNKYRIYLSYKTLQSDVKNYIKVLMQGDLKKIRVYNEALNALKYMRRKLLNLDIEDASITELVFDTIKDVNDAIQFVETNYVVIDDIDTESIDKMFNVCTAI